MASAGGAATATRMAAAVTAPSTGISELLAVTVTAWPFTWGAEPPEPLPGPLPVPGFEPEPVPGLEPEPGDELEPGEADELGLGDDPPAPDEQLSGDPSFWHLDGYLASFSTVSWPLVNVGLLHPAMVRKFGVVPWPGMRSTCRRPPLTRFSGSGEYPSGAVSRCPAHRK